MVIVCVRSVMLPHVSVTRYVRVMTCGHDLPSLTSERCVMCTWPQLSLACTTAMFAAGTLSAHCTVMGESVPTVGAVVSSMVIFWVTSVKLPHSSVARYVRVMTRGQLLPSDTSEMWVTVTLPHSP